MRSIALRDLGKAIEQRHLLRSQPWRRLLELAAFAVIGLHGWPLLFKLPCTLRVLFEALRPGGFGIAASDFWAFSQIDAAFRPWYSEIARDYHTQGRFGYVWDDGLGMSLDVRIYNNLTTYKLLHWLGARRMMASGYLLMVVMLALWCGWRFNPWVGIAVGVLAAGGSLIVGTITYQVLGTRHIQSGTQSPGELRNQRSR